MKNSKSLFSLSNKTIVVTGGCGLLGQQFCKTIAKFGGTPIILDKDISESKKLILNVFKNFKIKAYAYKCDITKETEVKKIYKILSKREKNLFGLINNAAHNPQPIKRKNKKEFINNLEKFNINTFNKELYVGLTGAVICSKIFGNHFAIKKKGSIINISSDLGIVAPNQRIYKHLKYYKPVTYSVIKHGIIGLTKYLTSYWGSKNVRCNTLAPGGVLNNQDKIFVRNIKKSIPSERMAKIDDFDGIIIYLLSDLSMHTNGTTISVDGGRAIY